MKAIIKYLPVEEKIKEGDKVKIVGNPDDEQLGQYADNNIFHTVTKTKDVSHLKGTSGLWIQTNKRNNWTDIAWFRKYKLFVVTQGIKEGEEVDHKKYKTFYDIKGGKGWFKILGEVSAYATFVEDGKEYEVLEVLKEISDIKDPLTEIFRAKCPCCGTFK